MKITMRWICALLSLLVLFAFCACTTNEKDAEESTKAEDGIAVKEGTLVMSLTESGEELAIFRFGGIKETYAMNQLDSVTWHYYAYPWLSSPPMLHGLQGERFFNAFLSSPIEFTKTEVPVSGVGCTVHLYSQSFLNFAVDTDTGVLIFTDSNGDQYVSRSGLTTFERMEEVFDSPWVDDLTVKTGDPVRHLGSSHAKDSFSLFIDDEENLVLIGCDGVFFQRPLSECVQIIDSICLPIESTPRVVSGEDCLTVLKLICHEPQTLSLSPNIPVYEEGEMRWEQVKELGKKSLRMTFRSNESEEGESLSLYYSHINDILMIEYKGNHYCTSSNAFDGDVMTRYMSVKT